MWPALRAGDRAELVDAQRARVGDVLVARSERGLIAHRLIDASTDQVVLQGDGCQHPDPAVPRSQVLGRIARVERGGRVLSRWDVKLPRVSRVHRAVAGLLWRGLLGRGGRR